MTYDASNPEHVAKAEKAEADRQKDIDYITKEPRGRRWLYSLIYDACHVARLSHVPGDADTSAFNEGGRAIGLALLEQLRDRNPERYMLMLSENHFDE